MKKSVLAMVTAFLAVGLFVGNVVMAEDMDKGPEEIILKTADAKKPAKLPHHAHQERMKCDDCHKSEHFAASADAWTKDAGHALCKDCHKANNGPTKCNDCHVKTKKKLEGC